jgi:hypothetical protein
MKSKGFSIVQIVGNFFINYQFFIILDYIFIYIRNVESTSHIRHCIWVREIKLKLKINIDVGSDPVISIIGNNVERYLNYF